MKADRRHKIKNNKSKELTRQMSNKHPPPLNHDEKSTVVLIVEIFENI
jgi:hypothetical protein